MPKDPSLFKFLRLKCGYCGQSKLRAPGGWMAFGAGCPTCNYKYEREPGYFTGASWMVNYAVTAVVGLLAAIFFIFKLPETNSSIIAGALGVLILVFGTIFMPFSKAIWMWLDHSLHPLTDADRLN